MFRKELIDLMVDVFGSKIAELNVVDTEYDITLIKQDVTFCDEHKVIKHKKTDEEKKYSRVLARFYRVEEKIKRNMYHNVKKSILFKFKCERDEQIVKNIIKTMVEKIKSTTNVNVEFITLALPLKDEYEIHMILIPTDFLDEENIKIVLAEIVKIDFIKIRSINSVLLLLRDEMLHCSKDGKSSLRTHDYQIGERTLFTSDGIKSAKKYFTKVNYCASILEKYNYLKTEYFLTTYNEKAIKTTRMIFRAKDYNL